MLSRIFRFGCLFFMLLYPSVILAISSPTVAPQVMPPHERLHDRIRRGEIQVPDFGALARQSMTPLAAQASPLSGTMRALAVVVDFSDHVHTVTASFFDSLIFAPLVSGRGSVRDYYNEVSYGQIDIVTVNLPSILGWVRAPQTYSYYVNNNYGTGSYPHNAQKLAEDIVDAISSVVNFATYDNNGDGLAEPIMIIHAGAGAEFTGNRNDIWSHSWTLFNPRTYNGVTISRYVIMPEYWQMVNPTTSDMTIGVFAHEMGHGFWNLPDLYDTDYSSAGIGKWSLMAAGSWNGPNGLGSSPAWPDAYCRVQMGFITPTEIIGTQLNKSLPQAYNNPPPAQTVLKLSSPFNAEEYFLVENRQQVPGSYDENLPGGGLLIWHVDENMTSNDNECATQPVCFCGQHYLVALEQADGLQNLEKGINQGDTGDPFPGTSNNRAWTMFTTPSSSSYYNCSDTHLGVTNISNSGAIMTADLNANSTPAIGLSPASLINSCPQGQNAPRQSFEVWNSGSGALNYAISVNAAWLSCSPTSGTSTGEHDTITVSYSTASLAPGTYQATITVAATGAGNNPQTILVTLTVIPPAPVANFSANPTNGPTPLMVQFTDTSTGAITSWSWDFGDGGTSNLQNPSHTYNIPGTYTVTLTVTGPGGTSTKTGTITATTSLIAGFSASPTSGPAPLTVQFTDTSTGALTSWFWNFGDGGTSTAQNPSHTYNNPGTYTVTLTVTGPGSTSTKAATIAVTSNIGANQILTGKLNKKGTKFTPASNFRRGNKVVIRAQVQDDQTLQPVSGAVVNITITGPGYTGGLTGTTDSNGLMVVPWPTSRKTTKGTYTVTVTNVTPPDPAETWDGGQTSSSFLIK